MDVQDHKIITSSEPEIHGVHLCHKCGWPFPNPHPSAKHRRAHKRVCGTIDGYKLIDSGSGHGNLAGSDNEQLSDDEPRTPSPNVDKGSIKETGSSVGMCLKWIRSEDELFSDAVTDFSDTGVSPSLEERPESVKKLDENAGGEFSHDLENIHVSKDEKTANTSQPLHGLTQSPQGSVKAKEMADLDAVRSERNQPEITKSISDSNSSRVIYEFVAVSDNSTMDSGFGKQKDLSSGLRMDIEEKEKGDEAVDLHSSTASEVLQSERKAKDDAAVDVHSTTASEVLQSEHKSEIEPMLEDIESETSRPVAREAMALETDQETSDPHVESDFQSELNNMNGETSNAAIVDEIINQEKKLTNDLQSKHDASSQVEPPKLQDALTFSEVESDSAKNLICSRTSQSDEVCDLKKAENEDTHLLSTAKILPAVENPKIMIGDFKDYNVLKFESPLDLGAAEEIRSAEDNKKVPVPGNLQNALSNVAAESIDNSPSDALKDDLVKEGVSTPIGGEIGSSVLENLPSAFSSVPPGTADNSLLDALEDDLKEEGVSTPIGGEVGTSVPDLPSAHSSVPARNAVNSYSKMVPVPDNLQNALSNIPTGSIDDSSSDALEYNLEKEGVSTSIEGEVGISVPENFPSVLSSVPAGMVDNSSFDALEDEPKKECVSTPSRGEVDTSVPENLSNVLSSVPAGTVDDSVLYALKDDLEKEGVSTSVGGEVGTSVPPVTSAHSSVPAGNLNNSSSNASEDDLKKEVVSTPAGGDVHTSVHENCRSALSSEPAGTLGNSSSVPSEDDLKREVVSTPIDEEFGASVPENLQSSLSNVPAGTVDNTSLRALEDDLEKKGDVLASSDGTAIPDNLPTGLSIVPAGTAGNPSSEAFEDDLKKEGVSALVGMEDGSSGFRVRSDEDTHLLSVGTLPAVENPEAMIGDFKDYKVSKSSFSLDVGAAKEIRSTEDDKKVTVSENQSALSNAPAGSIADSSSDTLENDLKKEDISIPIDGEVGSSEIMGTSDRDYHLLSMADTSPVVENPEVMIAEFKDYKLLKSSLPLDLGAAEDIRSVENERVLVPENLPSALSDVPAGSIDNSSSDALEDDLKKGGVSIPIDGEIGAAEFRFTGDADFVSSGLGDHPKTFGCEANDSHQRNNNLEGSLPQSVDGKSLQNENPEPTTRGHFDVIPLEYSVGERALQTNNVYGSENADNHGIDKLDCVATENGNMQAGDELSASITTTLTHVEATPETIEKSILLAGDDSLGHENSSMGFSTIAGNETSEVAAEKKLVKHTDTTHEPKQQLTDSASQVDIDVSGTGKFCNSSQSAKCSDVKMGEETDVPRSSGALAVVSEPECEDPTLSSEKTSENSRSEPTTASPTDSEFLNKGSASVEDMNVRDTTVLGPLLDDGEDKATKPKFGVLAVDNSLVSSGRTDSLEGNWGSISVVSTQSDVTAVADAEVLSTDTQAAERLDDAAKKTKPQGAATECHPEKSDVFEPPSFMTLVESGAGVDKNAAGAGPEIQNAQRDDAQSKSEAAMQAGWFPSLTNVVNESEGRKKNQEIIAKVTNWSTGKQHSPLKNLLSEAHAETKVKSPPNMQQVPAVNVNVNRSDEETASKNNGTVAAAAVVTTTTTISSILGSKMPSADDAVKKEMEKEWNSPARYPIQMKKEKRKGRPYWVPFVCCTSVHQDV